jgi:amino acid transporter
MLTHVPTEQERAVLTVGRWWGRWSRTRSMVAVVAALHLLGAFVLAFAPRDQLINVGTRPAFALMPPAAWAILFLLGGLSALAVLHEFTGVRQVLTWLTCVPAQATWAAASVLAVYDGSGSAMAVAFLPAIVAFTGITAVAVALDYAAGKR